MRLDGSGARMDGVSLSASRDPGAASVFQSWGACTG